jgi:hypothetical protein
MSRLSLAIGLIWAIALPCICHAQAVDDPFSDYLQRSDSIALGAGNASNANEAIQTINPWPPYAGNPRITIDGRQGVDAIERMHRIPNPFQRGGSGAAPGGTGLNAAPGNETQTGTSQVTPMQPVSSDE